MDTLHFATALLPRRADLPDSDQQTVEADRDEGRGFLVIQGTSPKHSRPISRDFILARCSQPHARGCLPNDTAFE